jgi:hypothetical protein
MPTTHVEKGYLALRAFASHMIQVHQVSDGLLTAHLTTPRHE